MIRSFLYILNVRYFKLLDPDMIYKQRQFLHREGIEASDYINMLKKYKLGKLCVDINDQLIESVCVCLDLRRRWNSFTSDFCSQRPR